MFRNLRLYRFSDAWPASEEELSQALQNAAFEACGPLTERSSGWVAVDSRAGGSLARRVNGADLIRLRSQSRILPPAAINEALELRIVEFEKRMGEAPGARDKRRLKAETRDELLPKAMLKSDRIWGYVDIRDKIIGIDTAQEANAERFLRRLRSAFGDLTLRPLVFREPVSGLLTRILLGNAPGQFAAGRECRMQAADDPKAIVRWSAFDLDDKSIRDHVARGMRLTHLGIEYDSVLGCVLDENGVIGKLRFPGIDEEPDAGGDVDDGALARQDAEFVLLTGTLRRFLNDLGKLLGGIA